MARFCFNFRAFVHRCRCARQFTFYHIDERRDELAGTPPDDMGGGHGEYCRTGFPFFGQFILRVMNISVGSFAIAGGLILMVLSIKYAPTGRMVEATRVTIAVVPHWHAARCRPGHYYHLTHPGYTISGLHRLDFLCAEYADYLDNIHV